MRGQFILAAVIVAAAFVARHPVGAEPLAAGETAVPGWAGEALDGRAGTWEMTTSYVMPGFSAGEPDHAVAERTIVDGVLVERVTGTMLQMPYTGEARSGYDAVSGLYWTAWSDNFSPVVVTLYGTYDPATATFTYEGTIADPELGEAGMQIAWTIEGPDRETVVYLADSNDTGRIEVMRVEYARAD